MTSYLEVFHVWSWSIGSNGFIIPLGFTKSKFFEKCTRYILLTFTRSINWKRCNIYTVVRINMGSRRFAPRNSLKEVNSWRKVYVSFCEPWQRLRVWRERFLHNGPRFLPFFRHNGVFASYKHSTVDFCWMLNLKLSIRYLFYLNLNWKQPNDCSRFSLFSYLFTFTTDDQLKYGFFYIFIKKDKGIRLCKHNFKVIRTYMYADPELEPLRHHHIITGLCPFNEYKYS